MFACSRAAITTIFIRQSIASAIVVNSGSIGDGVLQALLARACSSSQQAVAVCGQCSDRPGRVSRGNISNEDCALLIFKTSAVIPKICIALVNKLLHPNQVVDVSLHTVVSTGAFFSENHPHVATLPHSNTIAVQQEETPLTSYNFRCYLVDTVYESNSRSGVREYQEGHRSQLRASNWVRVEIIRDPVFGVNLLSFLQIIECIPLPFLQQRIIKPSRRSIRTVRNGVRCIGSGSRRDHIHVVGYLRRRHRNGENRGNATLVSRRLANPDTFHVSLLLRCTVSRGSITDEDGAPVVFFKTSAVIPNICSTLVVNANLGLQSIQLVTDHFPVVYTIIAQVESYIN